ncbi:MAG: phosphotransferase [Chlorobiaceae bacterium]|jgi:N-acetylmuramate 1-kinase|nr:phosphotransferase [Chlorobiaceae bacterium]
MTYQDIITGLFSPESRKSLDIVKIQGDASTRQYFRVISPEGSFISCYDPAFEALQGGEYPFLVLHELLAGHGIPVPGIKAVNPATGMLLLEDCGDLLLQNIFGSSLQDDIPRLYRRIIDILAGLQAIRSNSDSIPFNLSFDREKLMFEFDFFIRHGLLDYFASIYRKESISELRTEFESITGILVKPDKFVLNHRDFHSRNILIHHDKPVIIDFQDARMGLPQYDAVSLIRDSYVNLGPVLTDELKQYHYDALRGNGIITTGFDEYLHYFDIMAFQRNIKAIGTFCFQTRVRNNNTFERSIAPTLAYLSEYINARTELAKAGELLKPIIERYTA